MASDEAYADFLEKANRDPSEGYAKAKTGEEKKEPFRATEEGVAVPGVLSTATEGAFYTSDADEPFVPVALRYGGDSLPDEEEFARMIGHWDPSSAEVTISDPIEWDPEGQYGKLLDAVRRAGEGNDVRVYRVARGGARAEYWLVTREGDGAGSKLVGVKALAVES